MDDAIIKRLDAIEAFSLLSAKEMLTIEDVSYLTGLSKAYIYQLTCKKVIPFYKPNGRLIYFAKNEINDWLKTNRVCTIKEAEQQAINYTMRGGVTA